MKTARKNAKKKFYKKKKKKSSIKLFKEVITILFTSKYQKARRNTTKQFISKTLKNQKKYHKLNYQQNVKESEEILYNNLLAKY